ncbi:MAG: hypothetical protein HQK58_00030 [Deltaproteobacteria bacterium]|nr:hypothetical protein [Deltaproteobacteria bacterium]
MKDQIKLLIQLQGIDSSLDAMRQEMSAGPQELEQMKLETDELEQRLTQIQANVAEMGKKKRDLEGNIEADSESIEKSQGRLQQVKTNREFKATQKEVDDLKKRKRDAEEQLLALMEELEKTEITQKELTAELAEKKTGCQAKDEDVTKVNISFEKQIVELTEDKGKIAAAIPPELLHRYNFIRDRREGLALAGVVRGTCEACHLSIPPQEFINLQKAESLMTCPGCQRIIYWEPDIT